MRSDNKIDKVLWDVCSLVNKVKDGDDKRLDALKCGLIVLVYGKEKVEQGRMEIIQNLLESGLSAKQVSKLAKVPLNRVQSIKF